jgi:hypothetical protein
MQKSDSWNANPVRGSFSKPVYIQLPKAQIWRTILCAQGQKG